VAPLWKNLWWNELVKQIKNWIAFCYWFTNLVIIHVICFVW